jgi:tetratricopeptide (TPR) repeat protein
LFRCYLSLGDVPAAKQNIEKAKELDAQDANILKDVKTLEQVQNQERVVARHLDKGDYDTALNYIDQILAECPLSEGHTYQKLEYLLRSSKLQEAVAFSQQAAQTFKQSARI